MTRYAPRRNLWALTRRDNAVRAGGLTLARIQTLCGDAFKGASKTRLNDYASGNLRALTPEQERATIATLDALGLHVENFDLIGGGGWMDEMPVKVERRCSSMPKSHHLIPHALKGKTIVAAHGERSAHRTHVTRFDGSLGTRRGLDHWKRSTRMPLTDDVLSHFGLGADPFDAPRSLDELYRTRDFDAKERQLRQAIKRGGYCLVKGPSGSGKSMLAHCAIETLAKEQRLIVSRVMAPDTRKVSEYSIIYALVDDVRRGLRRPDITIPTSVERAMRRLREVVELASERQALPLLVIEEGHGVHDAIFKFLKRIREALQDGWKERLPVLIVGQDDASANATGRSLDDTLRDPDNREVARRLTIIETRPLGNAMHHHVRARVERVGGPGGDVAKVFDDDWAQAVRACLKADHLVPQAVEHLLSRSMTLAFEMGDARVGARHIQDAHERGA
jgi:type II secretory pathway predicted ATPase ExeA